MNVTILADASHCPQTLAGGYGFWIASQRGKLAGSGSLKGRIANSTVAEMMAIANAIHQGIVWGLIRSQDELLIQTDCQAAIDGFMKERKLSETENTVVCHVLKLQNRVQLKVIFKHVKGHTNHSDAKYSSNRVCDRVARRHMKRARESLRLEEMIELLKGSQYATIS